ncbi:MAG: hypothetical protein KatS3mg111_4071 [Pirellulaceae bacterium]|nr:MAG: hypothetical protein KatS3mg111_4071 [Pirellulaceae bacterium]
MGDITQSLKYGIAIAPVKITGKQACLSAGFFAAWGMEIGAVGFFPASPRAVSGGIVPIVEPKGEVPPT